MAPRLMSFPLYLSLSRLYSSSLTTLICYRSLCNTVVVQSLNSVWPFVTPWTAACQASLSFTISLSLFKLMSIESVMASNHYILCRPLLLLLGMSLTERNAPLFASLFFTISWSLLKLVSIESMMPSRQLILYSPLLLLPSIFPNIRVFSNKLTFCISWPEN